MTTQSHLKHVHVRSKSNTYQARIGTGKDAYKASCTGGEELAARACVAKWHTAAAAETVTRDPTGDQGEWVAYTFDPRKRAASPPATAGETGGKTGRPNTETPTAEAKAAKARTSSSPAPSTRSGQAGEAPSQNPGRLVTIPYAQINADRALQMREVHSDGDQIDNLVEAYGSDPGAVPPIDVFEGEGEQPYYIGDGWHRYFALGQLRRGEVPARVHPGGRPAALKHALGANAAHGLRRTNKDKRKAVTVALGEWPKLSDRAIAEICKVSHTTVIRIRKEVQVELCSTSRVGADGKTYPVKDPVQLDFWEKFRWEMTTAIQSCSSLVKDPGYRALWEEDPQRAAEELDATADALRTELREIQATARAIREGIAASGKAAAK